MIILSHCIFVTNKFGVLSQRKKQIHELEKELESAAACQDKRKRLRIVSWTGAPSSGRHQPVVRGVVEL